VPRRLGEVQGRGHLQRLLRVEGQRHAVEHGPGGRARGGRGEGAAKVAGERAAEAAGEPTEREREQHFGGGDDRSGLERRRPRIRGFLEEQGRSGNGSEKPLL
jgi:hypothetical protein